MSNPCVPKKDALYTIRLPRKALARLRAIEAQSNLKLTGMAMTIVMGLVQYEEQHRELRMPFKVIASQELTDLRAAAADLRRGKIR